MIGARCAASHSSRFWGSTARRSTRMVKVAHLGVPWCCGRVETRLIVAALISEGNLQAERKDGEKDKRFCI